MRLTTKDKELTYTLCQISFKPTRHCVGTLEEGLIGSVGTTSALGIPSQISPYSSSTAASTEPTAVLPDPLGLLVRGPRLSPISSVPTPYFPLAVPAFLLILRLPRSPLSGGGHPSPNFHLLSTHHPNIGSAYVLTP